MVYLLSYYSITRPGISKLAHLSHATKEMHFCWVYSEFIYSLAGKLATCRLVEIVVIHRLKIDINTFHEIDLNLKYKSHFLFIFTFYSFIIYNIYFLDQNEYIMSIKLSAVIHIFIAIWIFSIEFFHDIFSS